MDLCYQTIKRCVVALALWLVMSAIDCEAVPNAGVCVCVCVCVCVRLVRTGRKSLARVLTPIALDLSLSVSCNACCDAVCVHAITPLCVSGCC